MDEGFPIFHTWARQAGRGKVGNHEKRRSGLDSGSSHNHTDIVCHPLYLEPSFPRVVLGVYIIEVLMYANLLIYRRKLREAPPPIGIEHGEIFQL